jgi:hypothetical protein
VVQKMSNGTPKRQRDQPESDADRSRDLDKLNQQVVCSDLFGGGGREEDFQPASPEVERVIRSELHFDEMATSSRWMAFRNACIG